MDLSMLKLLASDWMRHDPDAHTRNAIARMLEDNDAAALASCFGARLQFGTAGLRGEMGPGPNRMNRLLVRRVSAGLAAYLLRAVDDAAERGVAISYDGRHGSKIFAEDCARVIASMGLRVYLSSGVAPTPFLAFATQDLDAAAGVMITASHNPPRDNGYKVFWTNGAQIVPPHDAGISKAIDDVDDVAEPMQIEALGDRVRSIPSAVRDRYFRRICGLRVRSAQGARVVYTAMHGVGKDFVLRALSEAGYEQLHVVPEQAEPDGDFPTVAFPNPEEPGALDLSYALAREVGADVVIANDPDADRLAVAIPDADGRWTQLSGNQVGLLLAEDLLAADQGERTTMVATTIVSTAMLRRVAEAHGARYAETLTGFKWIANAAIRHDDRGGRFVFGFEEALGYSAGSVVRDKDGVSAALLLVDLVAHLKRQGRTLWDGLETLYRQHGLHMSELVSVKLPGTQGAARIRAVLDELRRDPPTTIGGLGVAAVRDLAAGEGRRADGSTFRIDLPLSNVLAYDLDDGSRVLVRPSGTEPKIKLYFEVREELSDDESLEAGRARCLSKIAVLVADLDARTGLR